MASALGITVTELTQIDSTGSGIQGVLAERFGSSVAAALATLAVDSGPCILDHALI